MKVFAGNSNRQLAEAICSYLNVPLGKASVRRFADQEIFVEIQENVRGEDVFVVQSTSFPTNDHLMELLIMIDAFRRSSARRITAVLPYFGYARQDRRASGRTPISAKLVANLITEAGAHRVTTLDLHAGQIQGFFDIPTDNLYAVPLLARDIKEHYDTNNVMVVSPDVGGVVRARDRGIVGEAAVDFIRQFKVDSGLIGISGVEADGTLGEFDYREVEGARANLQTILDNLTAGVIVFDADGRIDTVNPGATRILRQPLFAYRGRRMSELEPLQ
eukprot:gene31318-35352_t